MMKSYITDRQIQLVGKAWEIRHMLRLLLKQVPEKQITLQEYLSTLKVHPSNNSMPPVPQNKPLEKNQGPRIIPFPSL